MVKHWLKDSSFRSLLKNSSYLAISRVVSAICGIATLAFAGRGLGPTLFGLLVLIHSYAQLASGLAKFQSWQLIIRYGGPALAKNEPAAFQHATGFAFALDISENTVKTHNQNIFAKIGVSDRTSAATTAIKRGLVRVDL